MKKTDKQLANIGVDFIIASIFARNEEVKQVSNEIVKLEDHDDIEFILGLFAGFFHEVCKNQKFNQLSEDELRSLAESNIIDETKKETDK